MNWISYGHKTKDEATLKLWDFTAQGIPEMDLEERSYRTRDGKLRWGVVDKA